MQVEITKKEYKVIEKLIDGEFRCEGFLETSLILDGHLNINGGAKLILTPEGKVLLVGPYLDLHKALNYIFGVVDRPVGRGV